MSLVQSFLKSYFCNPLFLSGLKWLQCDFDNHEVIFSSLYQFCKMSALYPRCPAAPQPVLAAALVLLAVLAAAIDPKIPVALPTCS